MPVIKGKSEGYQRAQRLKDKDIEPKKVPEFERKPGETFEEYAKRTKKLAEERKEDIKKSQKQRQTGVKRGELATGLTLGEQLEKSRQRAEWKGMRQQRQKQLQELAEKEYEQALAERPKFKQGESKPEQNVYGDYGEYQEAFQEWLEKNKGVLGRDKEKREKAQEILERAQEKEKDIIEEEFQEALAEKPSPINRRTSDYVQSINEWIEKNKAVFQTPEKFEEAQKVIKGDITKEDLSPKGKEQYEQYKDVLSQFQTVPGKEGKLYKGDTEKYLSLMTYDDTAYKRYMAPGTYKVFDPKTGTIKTMKREKTKEVELERHYYTPGGESYEYTAIDPRYKTKVISEQKVDITPKAKTLLTKDLAKQFGYSDPIAETQKRFREQWPIAKRRADYMKQFEQQQKKKKKKISRRKDKDEDQYTGPTYGEIAKDVLQDRKKKKKSRVNYGYNKPKSYLDGNKSAYFGK